MAQASHTMRAFSANGSLAQISGSYGGGSGLNSTVYSLRNQSERASLFHPQALGQRVQVASVQPERSRRGGPVAPMRLDRVLDHAPPELVELLGERAVGAGRRARRLCAHCGLQVDG